MSVAIYGSFKCKIDWVLVKPRNNSVFGPMSVNGLHNAVDNLQDIQGARQCIKQNINRIKSDNNVKHINTILLISTIVKPLHLLPKLISAYMITSMHSADGDTLYMLTIVCIFFIKSL